MNHSQINPENEVIKSEELYGDFCERCGSFNVITAWYKWYNGAKLLQTKKTIICRDCWHKFRTW